MATVSDITVTPLSGLNHIDALLDKGPDWNYLTNSNGNVLYFTFSTASGNENGKSGQEAFSTAQQAAARTAFAYLQQVTGIEFRETTSGTDAQIHLANMNLDGATTLGLCSWQVGYRHAGETLTEYSANAYVYLDNVEWRAANQNLTPGSQGYATLLHELGHALGLKHPFYEATGETQIVLPTAEDHTANTIMSYTQRGGHASTFSPYDIAALNWLYGGDGLRGELGINSNGGGRYITGSFKSETLTGTPYNDTLQGNGGINMIDGGAGIDTVVFNGNRNTYTFSTLADGSLVVANSAGSSDTLSNIEWLRFADATVARADVVTADTVAPDAPVMAITQNSADYATTGNILLMNGRAEANSTVNVYIDGILIATTQANASGLWNARSNQQIPDGLNYKAYATATDAAGNVSASSNIVNFHVDATAPSVPTINLALGAGGNRPAFTGVGEAGTTIELYRDTDYLKIGSVVVGADGNWSLTPQPLPNGSYNVIVTSVDLAGNARAGQSAVALTINNGSFQAGTANADTIVINPGSTAVDGGAGVDTVVYAGLRGDHAIKKETWGFSVTAANGEVDGLYNVERVKFDDGWKAIDDQSAQVFRLYQAVFNRQSDDAGLGYWNWRMDTGTTLNDVAKEFMNQPEFRQFYGDNPTDQQFIEALYQNVLKREPDAGGLLYWTEAISVNGRAQTLTYFSESPENQALVIDTVGKGLDFVPWPV